jgi:hypothetical protein
MKNEETGKYCANITKRTFSVPLIHINQKREI